MLECCKAVKNMSAILVRIRLYFPVYSSLNKLGYFYKQIVSTKKRQSCKIVTFIWGLRVCSLGDRLR